MASITRQPDNQDLFAASTAMAPPEPDEEEISQAAWEMSPTAGMIDYFQTPSFPSDPGFEPDMNTLDKEFWGIWDELSDSGSIEEFRHIQMQEVKNQDRWQTIEEGGVGAYAEMIGYDMLDPATMPFWFIPFVGQGGRVANMVRGGAAIGTEMSIRESVAHWQQPSRTIAETVPLVMGMSVLGMGLGASLRPSLKNVPTEDLDNMVKESEKIYKGSVDEAMEETKKGQPLSASAVTVYGKPARLDEEVVISPKKIAGLKVNSANSRLGDSVRRSGGTLAEPSAISDELTRSFLPKGRDEMNIAPVYPNGKTKPWDEEVQNIQRFGSAYAGEMNKSARAIINKKIKRQFLPKEPILSSLNKISYADTSNILSRMARYGDDFWIPPTLARKYPGLDTAIDDLRPLVDDFLEMRRRVWTSRMEQRGMFGYVQEPILKADGTPKLKRNGEPYMTNKLDQNGKPIPLKESDLPRYSQNHMHTSYSRKAIRKNPENFAEAVARGYANPEREAMTGLAPDIRTPEELYERGLDAISNVTSSAKLNPGDGAGVSKHYGPPTTKPITLKVLRKDIDDYIVHSIDDELNYLTKKVEPILNGMERYGDEGLIWTDNGISVPALFKRMEDEMLSKRTALSQDQPKFEKMMAAYEQSVKDVQYVINKITGADIQGMSYNAGLASVLNELRAAASFAWLGNVAMASAHEVARTQMLHGLGPMAKSMGIVINPTDLSKANVNQLKRYYMALDMESARSTAMIRAEIEDPVALSGVGSFASRNVNKIYKVTGMDLMITAMKRVEGFAFMTDAVDFALGQGAKAGTGAYKAAKRNFTRFGLTSKEMKGLAKQVKNGGIVKERGVWLVDEAKFTDGKLLDKFREITAAAGDTSIVTGIAGDIPTMLDNPIGRSIVQFKRVFFGYQNRMESLALSLKEGDFRAATGLMTSFALTWQMWQLRMFLKYMDDPETAAENFAKEWNEQSISDHIYQMVTRTGFTGLAHIGLEQFDKLTKGGLSHAINTNVGSKHFRGDGKVIADMIPSLTYAEKAMSAMTAAFKEGGATAKDVKKAGTLLPLNSVIGIDQTLDAIANSFGTTVNNPSKRAKKAAEQGVDIR